MGEELGCFFQGVNSREYDMKLGTPQGGVLEPAFLSVIINITEEEE